MLISPAHAQAAGGGGFLGGVGGLLPLVLIFVVFYFLLIRPQQKKAKLHKDMLAAIRRGDRIVTGGGIVGTVVRVVGDDELQVDITDDVRVRVVRGMVSNVLQRAAPADLYDDEDEDEERPKPRRPKRRRSSRRTRKETATDRDDEAEAPQAEAIEDVGEGASGEEKTNGEGR